MVIRETIELYIEDSSMENFESEIKLLKSAGYEVIEQYEDYVSFRQIINVDEFVK